AIDTTNGTLPGGLPNYDDANGTINTPPSLPNLQNPLVAEVDYRDPSLDSDMDGVIDTVDVDDDNDGILDINESDCNGEITYEFYDVSPTGNTVDNIPTTGALATGVFTSFDVDALQALVDPGDSERFSIRYQGSILIQTADTYTFFTSSDDGSKLFIDGTEIVDNDGAHGVRERNGTVFLNAGFHTITVLFFERTGGEFLSVNYQSSTIAKTQIPFSAIFPAGDECDTDGDGIINRLDSDSDNDNCNDANEAYDSLSADGDGDGIFGIGTPSINPDGSVVGAPYTMPVDINTNGAFDFLEMGSGAPSITAQPSDITACLGCSADFTVVGTADVFQWQSFDGSNWNDLSNTTPFSGVDTTTLTINPLDTSLNGVRFRVIL
ncbi:MAG: PA14 domain-containing protein, partial [Bacteroidota bacterium]